MQHWFRKKYEWMRQNKRWLFSGIGVIPIMVIYSLLIPMWMQDTDLPKGSDSLETVDKQALSSIRLVDTLTPEGVIEAVIDALPLQRKAVGQSYVGIKVSWKSDVLNMSRQSETVLGHGTDTNLVRIVLRVGRVSFIIFNVKLDEYPGLELLQEGDSISVEGEIVKVDDRHVELANVKVSF